MFSLATTRLILLGIVFLLLGWPATARDEIYPTVGYVMNSGERGIFVLEIVTRSIYQLGMDESGTGWFREIYTAEKRFSRTLPALGVDDSGGFILILDAGCGVDAMRVDPDTKDVRIVSDGYPLLILKETLLAFESGELAIHTPDESWMERPAGVRIDTEEDDNFLFPKPDGEFLAPVAAMSPDGEWYVIWPRKQEFAKPEGWWTFSSQGHSPAGELVVMHTSDGQEISQYEIVNPQFSETRAEALEGFVVGDDGRLFLLDDKGYISVFDGEEMTDHFFAGLSPSRSVKNSIARGPDDGLLVSDGVSRVINLFGPDGEQRYSWRIPAKKKIAKPSELKISIIFDIVVVVLIIIIAGSIIRRKKRRRLYNRTENE